MMLDLIGLTSAATCISMTSAPASAKASTTLTMISVSTCTTASTSCRAAWRHGSKVEINSSCKKGSSAEAGMNGRFVFRGRGSIARERIDNSPECSQSDRMFSDRSKALRQCSQSARMFEKAADKPRRDQLGRRFESIQDNGVE